MPGTSAIWGVTVTLSAVAQANASVTITNQTTNETQQTDTNSDGEVIFNLANFTSGWTSGDVIKTYAEYSTYEATDTRQATGSASFSLALATKTSSASLRYFTTTEFLDSMQMSNNTDDTVNGLNTETIKLIGDSQEEMIDRILEQKFDATYTVTDEYHNADKWQDNWFTYKTPILSVTKFEVNTTTPDSDENWVDIVADGDSYDLNTKGDIGRIQLTDSANFPEPGKDQVRTTYTYGYSSVPKDIKRLAILMTARAMNINTINRIGISAIEDSGLSSTYQHFQSFDSEINAIIENRRMGKIEYV